MMQCNVGGFAFLMCAVLSLLGVSFHPVGLDFLMVLEYYIKSVPRVSCFHSHVDPHFPISKAGLSICFSRTFLDYHLHDAPHLCLGRYWLCAHSSSWFYNSQQEPTCKCTCATSRRVRQLFDRVLFLSGFCWYF
jgi:hypothetical protein